MCTKKEETKKKLFFTSHQQMLLELWSGLDQLSWLSSSQDFAHPHSVGEGGTLEIQYGCCAALLSKEQFFVHSILSYCNTTSVLLRREKQA